MNLHATYSYYRRKKQRGFSLVELAVALGIMAFALTAILGLVPIGLTTLQTSMHEAAQTNIVQSLLNDAYSSDLDTLVASTHYFNEAGQKLSAPEDEEWIYEARLSLRSLQLQDTSGSINLSSQIGQTLLIGIESRTKVPSDPDWSLDNLDTLPDEIDLHTAVLVQQ